MEGWAENLEYSIPRSSSASTTVIKTATDLNQRVKTATKDAVDLRFLVPLGFGILAMRQLVVKGWQLELIPWYVLAWYAFDSFIKLHSNNEQYVGREQKSSFQNF